jgi:hypothetical protein
MRVRRPSVAVCRQVHNFRGDNSTGIHPRILNAMIQANEAPAKVEWSGYGSDPITNRLLNSFSKAFQLENRTQHMQVFPVATGSAANALSIATMVGNSVGTVLCSDSVSQHASCSDLKVHYKNKKNVFNRHIYLPTKSTQYPFFLEGRKWCRFLARLGIMER